MLTFSETIEQQIELTIKRIRESTKDEKSLSFYEGKLSALTLVRDEIKKHNDYFDNMTTDWKIEFNPVLMDNKSFIDDPEVLRIWLNGNLAGGGQLVTSYPCEKGIMFIFLKTA